MNTTDCEKIECKLGKEFQFETKFDEGFVEQRDEEVRGGEHGTEEGHRRAEYVNKKADIADALLGVGEGLDEKPQAVRALIADANSCDGGFKEKQKDSPSLVMASDCFANFSDMEAALVPEPPATNIKSMATVVLTPPPVEETASSPEDPCGYEYSVYDDALQPLSERWSPVGANYDDAITPTSELMSPESELELLSSDSQDKHELPDDPAEMARLKSLEEEQEMLTSSLMALTSHFAHVQLRVRQIVEAPANERDQLLKDLEEFAFRGIPEPTSALMASSASRSGSALQNHDEDGKTPHLDQRQFELIDHLKTQLTELEKIAYESGAPVLPQHILLEKQKIIIDELKSKLNFKVDEQKLPELTAEELKSQVDNAIGEFVGPLKMKEQLVAQLKTQITDLERFIAFLQCDTDESKLKTLTGGEKLSEAYNSYAAKKKRESLQDNSLPVTVKADAVGKGEDGICKAAGQLEVNRNVSHAATDAAGVRDSLQTKAHSLMDKASLLMQMFATTHFGAKPDQFQKNTLKKTNKGNHWGDLRAQLEVDIQEVASLAATLSFDREKLAKLRKSMKKPNRSADASSSSSCYTSLNGGILTTVPPTRSGNRPKSNNQQLKPYQMSSDSEEDDDDEDEEAGEGAGVYYKWQQRNNRRLAQCARIRGDTINTLSKELTAAVRKNFAMTLLKLIQHGLRVESMPPVTSSLIVPFMRCLNPSPVFVAEHNFRARDYDAASFMSSSAAFGYDDSEGLDASSGANWNNGDGTGGSLFASGNSRPMHGWELVLEYYYLKHGDEYNNTPARKLSQSFNLDIVNAQAVTAKQNLLSAVGSIIAMHRPYKRSYNAHFKAFVCAGLNCHQLVEWLNLIFSCSDLVDNYYTASSYVACTGFRDALRSIDGLSKYDFDLPIDLAIRHFRNL